MPKPRMFGMTDIEAANLAESSLTAIDDAYRRADVRLTRIVAKAGTESSRVRATELQRQVRIIRGRLNKAVKDHSSNLIRGDYANAALTTRGALANLGNDIARTPFARIHTAAVNVVTEQMSVELLAANNSIAKRVGSYIRLTQQQLVAEEAINRSIAAGLIEGQTRRATSSEFHKLLQTQLQDGKFMSVNGRSYRPDKYAELVTRTRTREAVTGGAIDTNLEYGNDLIQVSVHVHGIDPCTPFAGRVFSISGTDPVFPALTERPPYHPNCKHVLVPVNDAILKSRGQYEALAELSNDPDAVFDNHSDFVSQRNALEGTTV